MKEEIFFAPRAKNRSAKTKRQEVTLIIDFHTHVFPDAIAERAIKHLYQEAHGLFDYYSDGTLLGLLDNMDKARVDISVTAPVITKQSQFRPANEFAAGIVSDRIVSFGCVYPHTCDYKADIDYVCSLGLKGLKFHAEYQDFIVDDPHMLKIYDYALSKGLIILHHAGFDPAFSPPFKAPPKAFRVLSDTLKGGVIIAAHLGGSNDWDNVEKYLVGSNIYFDTSMGFDFYSHEQFLRIVKNHGVEKILFGSDSPWSDAESEIAHIRALPLEKSELDMILGNNAKKILLDIYGGKCSYNREDVT